jgi:glucuronoarabinoxylan endo-1,4-beta-xylanase
MRKLLLLLGLIAYIYAGLVTVDASQKYQMIRGIGGINLPDWGVDLTDAQRVTAFTNCDNCLGFSMLRVYVSDDKNAWSKSVPVAKYAQQQGATLFATPWNPPSSMCEKFSGGGRSGKRLRYDKYNDYANHLVSFINYMKGQGVNIYGISVQNEPDYGQEWTWWTSAECVNFLVNQAPTIRKVTKMISPETFQYNKQYYKDILNNAKANANTDIFATHFYGTLRSQMDFPQLENGLYPRELWMTEVYVPNSSSQADKWPEAIEVAVNMHNAFVIGGMNAYIWWYIRRSYGPMLENGKISKRGYMMAHFSKYVRPFAGRVGATESPASNVWVSAYRNMNNGSLVIVAINNSDASFSQQFEVKGFTVKRVDRYRTSSSENLAKTGNMALSGNGFWAQMNPRTVQTFVCS